MQRIEIISSIFPDHSGIKLDINSKKNFGNYTNTWTLNSMLLNDKYVNETIFVKGIRKESSFSFLHMASQFSPHHLLNRESPLLVFVRFVKDQLVVDVWYYF